MSGDESERELYHRAVADVLEFRKASASFLQRRLMIGYSKAASLIEKMEADRIVGPVDHVGRREILVDRDRGCAEPAPAPWNRNQGKYDRMMAPIPRRTPPPPRDAMPEPPTYDPEIERRALRGVRAVPAAAPVARVERPPLEGWPAELDVEDGALVARDLAVMEERPRDPDAIAADRLRQIVLRLEALIAQRDEISSIMRDVRAFAKALDFDTKAITAVIKMRAQEKTARQEFEAMLDCYRHALGIEGPDFAVALPPPTAEIPPPPRRLTARERQAREAILLADASRIAEASLSSGSSFP